MSVNVCRLAQIPVKNLKKKQDEGDHISATENEDAFQVVNWFSNIILQDYQAP